jgi:hypothetical protein
MSAKFRVGDAVRFIGTCTLYIVREYNPATSEYRVQDGDDIASSQWASEIYFEHVNPARVLAVKPRTINTDSGAI